MAHILRRTKFSLCILEKKHCSLACLKEKLHEFSVIRENDNAMWQMYEVIHNFADNAKLNKRKLNLLRMIIKFIMPFICRLTCNEIVPKPLPKPSQNGKKDAMDIKSTLKLIQFTLQLKSGNLERTCIFFSSYKSFELLNRRKKNQETAS